MSHGVPKLRSNQTGYYPPELLPLVLCLVTLDVALKNSEKARTAYNQVLEAYRLPDIKEGMYRLELKIPSGQELKNVFLESLKAENKALPDGEFIESFFMNMTMKYGGVLAPWLDLKNNRCKSKDWECWYNAVQEVIKAGFNRRSDWARGNNKVRPECSGKLFSAIHMRAYSEFCKLKILELDTGKAIQVKGAIYPIDKNLIGEGSERFRRYLVTQKKRAGYWMRHDETIIKGALRWYECRVMYSGIQEYCDVMLKHGYTLDPSNVSNEIKPFDLALGYSRDE